MKKTLLPLASIAIIATSCVNDDEIRVNFDSQTEIRPTASISILSRTRAIEEGAAFAGTDGVFAVTALYANGTAKFSDLAVNKSGDSYAFSTQQYFPSDGRTLDFYAYSPIANDYSKGSYSGTTASWTLDGTQDILWANGGTHGKVTSANGETPTQTHPAFNFAHKLALFDINIKLGEGFSSNIEITSMKVLAVKNKVSLNLISGDLTPTDVTTADLDVPFKQTMTIGSDPALYGRIMLPVATQYDLLVTTTGGITYPVIHLYASDVIDTDGLGRSITSYEAGNEYDVTLTFTGTEITTSASIKEWITGGSVAQTVQ